MVKLVDTPASGAGDLTVVEVRVFFWAPILHKNPRKRVFAFLGFVNSFSLTVGAVRGRETGDLVPQILHGAPFAADDRSYGGFERRTST
jgi:hypothetical protein